MVVRLFSLLTMIAAGIGLRYAFKNAAAAKLDRYFVQHHLHAGTRLFIAQEAIRRERVRILVLAGFLFAGMVGFRYVPTATPLVASRIVASLSVIVGIAATTWNSIADNRFRERIDAMIDRDESQVAAKVAATTEHRVRGDIARQQAQEFNEAYERRRREEE